MKLVIASIGALAALAPHPNCQVGGGGISDNEYFGNEHVGGNILLLIADDIGVDMINAYAEGVDLPPTPNLDWLAANGVLFRNAYSNPAGSVTMSTIETGRYSQRTGIGYVIYEGDMPLQPEEVILPELLRMSSGPRYRSAMIGKWFLGNGGVGDTYNPMGPLIAGYDHFEGIVGQLYLGGYDYFNHEIIKNGIVEPSNTYATTEQVNSALSFIETSEEPWFTHVAFNVGHTPFHIPPAELFTIEAPATIPPHGNARPWFLPMVEAMDTELGRLFASIDPDVMSRTTIIFLTDNGTPDGIVVPPFVKGHGKLTVYEGGVNVPLIIAGPHVNDPGREETALVNTVDIFATIADMARIDLDVVMPPGVELDSVSMYPYLVSENARDQRETVYSEMFFPNGFEGPWTTENYAVRDQRWKLMQTASGLGAPLKERMFDLIADPFESTDLLGPGHTLTRAEELAYQRLSAELAAITSLP